VLTGKTAEGTPPHGFLPEASMSLEDAILAYRVGAAFGETRSPSRGIGSQFHYQTGKTEVPLTILAGKTAYPSAHWPNNWQGKPPHGSLPEESMSLEDAI